MIVDSSSTMNANEDLRELYQIPEKAIIGPRERLLASKRENCLVRSGVGGHPRIIAN